MLLEDLFQYLEPETLAKVLQDVMRYGEGKDIPQVFELAATIFKMYFSFDDQQRLLVTLAYDKTGAAKMLLESIK